MGGSFPGHEGATILDHLRLTGSGGSKARSYTTTHALDSPLEDIEISIREIRCVSVHPLLLLTWFVLPKTVNSPHFGLAHMLHCMRNNQALRAE